MGTGGGSCGRSLVGTGGGVVETAGLSVAGGGMGGARDGGSSTFDTGRLAVVAAGGTGAAVVGGLEAGSSLGFSALGRAGAVSEGGWLSSTAGMAAE